MILKNILNFMQKIINNNFDFRNLIKFSFITIIGQGIGIFIPLIAAKIFLPELFGSFSLSLAISLFFLALLINPTQTPFIISAVNEKNVSNKINKTFTIQLIFFIISILIFLLLFIVFKKYIAIFTNTNLTTIWFIYFGLVGISIKTNIVSLFLALNKKFHSAIVELIFNLFLLILIIIAQFYIPLNINIIFISYLISSLLLILYFFIFIKKDIYTPLKFNLNTFKVMLNFAKWQIFGLSAAYLVNWGDNIVLRIYTNLNDIGIYNLSYQIFKTVITATYIINSYYIGFVTINIKNKEKMINYFTNTRKIIFIVGFLGIFLLIIISPILLKFIYGNLYSDSANILIILMLGAILSLYNIFYIPVFNVLNKFKFIQFSLIIQILINLSLDFLLVPFIGISGAAISTLIGYIFIFIIYEWYYKTKIKKLIYNINPSF